MNKLVLALLLLASPAFADPPVIKDTFGFDWLMPEKSTCTKVSGALLAKLTKQYTCVVPEDPTASASGKRIVAKCTKGTKSEFLLFATKKECTLERETQLANAE